jgi:hypothetical protein
MAVQDSVFEIGGSACLGRQQSRQARLLCKKGVLELLEHFLNVLSIIST